MPVKKQAARVYSRSEAVCPAARGSRRKGFALKQAFLLGSFAGQFAGASHSLGLFTGPALRRLFKILPHFHFAEDALALQLLLQGAKRLIDIIVANTDLYQWSSPSKFANFRRIFTGQSVFQSHLQSLESRAQTTLRQALPADCGGL
jgi:hypothetical protein